MKLEELAAIMGKDVEELKKILEKDDVIDLKLTEKASKKTKEKKEREMEMII